MEKTYCGHELICNCCSKPEILAVCDRAPGHKGKHGNTLEWEDGDKMNPNNIGLIEPSRE